MTPAPTPTLRCKMCNCELNTESVLSRDCGGDCLACMAEAGDPDCIKTIIAALRARPGIDAFRYRFECDGQRWVDEYAASHCPVCKKPVIGERIVDAEPVAWRWRTLRNSLGETSIRNWEYVASRRPLWPHEGEDWECEPLYSHPPIPAPPAQWAGQHVLTDGERAVLESAYRKSHKIVDEGELLDPPAQPAEPSEGYTMECSRCPATVLLPYTDETKTYIAIAPAEGWSSPPVLCPACTRPPSAQKENGK